MPIEQLKAERDRLLAEVAARGVEAIHKQADAMYHNACILGQIAGLSENHPAIRAAEGAYMDALATQGDVPPVETARKMLDATMKLEYVIFADELLG